VLGSTKKFNLYACKDAEGYRRNDEKEREDSKSIRKDEINVAAKRALFLLGLLIFGLLLGLFTIWI